MPIKLLDLRCTSCHHLFEYLLMGDETYPKCPLCDAEATPTISKPLVTKLHDPEALKNCLKQRSADHTNAQIRKLAGHRGTLPSKFGRRGFQAGDH